MKIAYVCTNYNNTHYSREAVRSLLLNTGHSYAIVIVDNASAAPSIAELQALAAEKNVELDGTETKDRLIELLQGK